MNETLFYKKGYKYVVQKDINFETGLCPMKNVSTKFILLGTDGILTILTGYAWDGPSGPLLDLDNRMPASLGHDAFYQLMREKEIPYFPFKLGSDLFFFDMCVKYGVRKYKAKCYHWGLKKFGKRAATKPRKVYQIPKVVS